MTKTKKSAKPISVEKLEDSIHEAYHFLYEWGTMPDSDQWRENYVYEAIKILYPDECVDVVTNQSADILQKRVTDTAQYLLKAGTEGGRNEDELNRFHVLTAVNILIGNHYHGPVYHRDTK